MIGFVNDIIVYCRRMHIDDLIEILQRVLRGIKDWLSGLFLSLALNKCSFTIFSRNHKYISASDYCLTLDLDSILNSDYIKYLGTIWDTALNWKEH